MKCIKQRAKDLNCVACVAAMITGQTVSYVHEWCQVIEGQPIHDSLLYKYLAAHDFQMGIGFQYDYISIEPNWQLQGNWSFLQQRAYIAVRSKSNSSLTHAIYWNGEEVFDPSPIVPGNGLKLSEYEIEQIWPIIPFPK